MEGFRWTTVALSKTYLSLVWYGMFQVPSLSENMVNVPVNQISQIASTKPW